MQACDKQRFGLVMRDLAELYEKDLNPAIYWRAMMSFSIEEIEQAKDAHICDPKAGRFCPKPADLITQIERRENRHSPRLSADEAWAIALQSLDEATTVVWTDEIAQAMESAREVLDFGDRVGARMAFISAYRRISEQNRANGVMTQWLVSLGWDEEGRRDAIEHAITQGFLTDEQAQHYLPEPVTPSNPVVALLKSDNVVPHPSAEAAKLREVARMRTILNREPPKEDKAAERQNRRDMLEKKKSDALDALKGAS